MLSDVACDLKLLLLALEDLNKDVQLYRFEVANYKMRKERKRNQPVIKSEEIETTTPGQFVCEFCPKKFLSMVSLQLHRNNHENEAKFICPRCPKQYHLEVLLKKHVAKMHGKGSGPILQLTKTLASSKQNASKNDSSNRICKVCDKVFSGYYQLSVHMTEVHSAILTI